MSFQETTKPLMRPRQVEEAKEEAARIEGMLSAPPHVSNAVQDRGEAVRQLHSLQTSLEHQAPKPYSSAEVDAAAAREKELLSDITTGMPTQAEMRRNPVGAVDKHRSWERRNKAKIQEWKNIRLRQHASHNGDTSETDIANLERYRPVGGSQELNMDHEQIPGRIQHGPVPGAGPAVVFNPEDRAALEAVDPELASQLALMSNEERQKVKDFLANRRAQSERMKAMHARKRAEKEG